MEGFELCAPSKDGTLLKLSFPDVGHKEEKGSCQLSKTNHGVKLYFSPKCKIVQV